MGIASASKAKRVESKFTYTATAPLPQAVDWRKSGVVTPVKDQGSFLADHKCNTMQENVVLAGLLLLLKLLKAILHLLPDNWLFCLNNKFLTALQTHKNVEELEDAKEEHLKLV